MNIFLDTIGCRLNQSEIETFANTFRALGHKIVADPAQADLAIVNTCTVTVKAAADSRKQLRRAGRKGAKQVIATGCWATLEPEAALALPGVTQVFTNADKDLLGPSLTGISAETLAQMNLVREPIPGDRSRTRAFIKVQEGCDNHCTYCLTRIARGRSRSRSLAEVDRDIRAALAGDAKEIVLTGVQLGAWGRDLPDSLCLVDLLQSVLAHEGVRRVRLSSIEPWDFDLEMLSLWEDPRVCRHLHIPLQAGSDRVLKAMGRPILSGAYAGLIGRIREVIPEIAVTTDVIAGFPGETEEGFAETLALIERLDFAGGHVFTFSPRPGTAAIKMRDQVPMSVARARNAVIRAAFAKSGSAYRLKFVGRSPSVLWESSDRDENGQWRLSGLTDNYLRVHTTSQTDLWNAISQVTLVGEHPRRKALIGEIQILSLGE